MKTRYRLIRRGIRGDKFYCVDNTTGKRTSLGTASEDDAPQIVEAKNNSERQPVLNLQIAKAYLADSDKGIATRTWQNAIESLTSTKLAENQKRWKTAAKDKAFVSKFLRQIARQNDFHSANNPSVIPVKMFSVAGHQQLRAARRRAG